MKHEGVYVKTNYCSYNNIERIIKALAIFPDIEIKKKTDNGEEMYAFVANEYDANCLELNDLDHKNFMEFYNETHNKENPYSDEFFKAAIFTLNETLSPHLKNGQILLISDFSCGKDCVPYGSVSAYTNEKCIANVNTTDIYRHVRVITGIDPGYISG